MARKVNKRSRLVKKIDSAFSQYVRLRAAGEDGYGECFTCGVSRHWTEVDAGHFMSRACMSTRWEPRNVQFQCKRCNGFRSGEQYKFSVHLDQQYGEGTAEELHRLSKQTRKFSMAELEHLYEHFKRLADEVRQQKGL